MMGGGKVKLADFGISKAVNGVNVLNVSKMGTPIYTSPEVLRKQPFDYKIDIWALGCIVHYIACLEIPFNSISISSSPLGN
jgi:NIMA (never in mitosis gene a)-related kinase